MTVPNNPLDNVKVDVPEPVMSSAKAVAAAVPTVAGLVALFVSQVADGSMSGAEGWTFAGAVVTAVTTIVAVFQTRNKVKA